MVTMRDIAVHTGVSRSTVSFVLNDKHDDFTVHVPTTSPPQGAPAGQDGTAAPPVPPVPGLVAGVHAPEAIPKATISAETANCTFTGTPSEGD